MMDRTAKDRTAIERLLETNHYLVLGTSDTTGRPWVSPVFFAAFGTERVCWVSSPDSRHSRNIAERAAIAITVFDSTVAVGRAEAAYFDAEAGRAAPPEVEAALRALNARLPGDKQLVVDDLQPAGPLVVYLAELRHRYVLVRGGDPDHGNDLDMTLEV
ncbi:pyridoxamine 5'-phosphate oxidase family protein [Leifsonia poae]|uniref:Pyridoxamine 5'-phosphate oxidase N-terminal domain-containing protein n=1 Tax=Leifsonia poae TaxID=110933 RepID=A0A9W6LXX3_9MICO|nr:pyridoxamine 5'-phosphate oxidase family protein [Leifsonia poae]GLJ74593.1 hypothetical protein GCM10017584_01660 [Leifsonia poae]